MENQDKLQQLLINLRTDRKYSRATAVKNCMISENALRYWELGISSPTIILLNDYLEQYGIKCKPCKIEEDETTD